MNTWFVDANVFLRFLTIDDQGQHGQAARLLLIYDHVLGAETVTSPSEEV